MNQYCSSANYLIGGNNIVIANWGQNPKPSLLLIMLILHALYSTTLQEQESHLVTVINSGLGPEHEELYDLMKAPSQLLGEGIFSVLAC